jgi:hypothetical protein
MIADAPFRRGGRKHANLEQAQAEWNQRSFVIPAGAKRRAGIRRHEYQGRHLDPGSALRAVRDDGPALPAFPVSVKLV